jgi:hypothetical protein
LKGEVEVSEATRMFVVIVLEYVCWILVFRSTNGDQALSVDGVKKIDSR